MLIDRMIELKKIYDKRVGSETYPEKIDSQQRVKNRNAAFKSMGDYYLRITEPKK